MATHDENPRTEPRPKAAVRDTDARASAGPNDQQSVSRPAEGNDSSALEENSGTGATASRPRGHTEDPDKTL